MKVAIFEPFPRMCGVTAWTFHIAQGFRDLGHQGDVVSFTKSGRRRTTKSRRRDGSIGSGWHWWMETPDVVERWCDAAEVLNGYDLIVLNEPKNGTVDRQALREKNTPPYVTALCETKTPWMTILHAPQYDTKRTPFLASTLDAGHFTGVVIEHQPGSYDSGSAAFEGRVRVIQPWPWLPYRQRGRVANAVREPVLGLGGRMTPNKGHATLAVYADCYPTGWSTRLLGSESGGAGAGYSFLLYEALATHHGWTGSRFGQQQVPNEINNYGDTIHGWPWWLQRNGHLIRYTGPYDDLLATWSSIGIAVNLTSQDFAVGLEYTTLEAMDAGCAIILPAHSLERTGRDQYAVSILEKFTKPVSISTKYGIRLDHFDAAVGDELVNAIDDTVQHVTGGSHDPEINRRALTQYHDPRHLAGQILELTGG